ncbi:D-glycero-beta-D-manno-heptose 1,7-bisphosphate 7-phosphatase [Candidatus Margulisiibacteriota bacterium]
MNKAVFLDRDGTINEDTGYLSHPSELKMIPKSAEAIRHLNEAGFKVFTISNQSGVARGYFSEDMLQSIDKKLQKEVLKGGGYIDGIYYCPHHPEHGVHPYKMQCECRKPHNGLIKKAAKKFDIDLGHSYMIGDKLTDIQTGKKSGMKTALVLTGRGKKESESKGFGGAKPDHVAKDLYTAVKWVLEDKGNV